MSSIFFGDSITEGSNSAMNFCQYLSQTQGNCFNEGVSGTTIGEYSIYPVDGNSLLEKYKKSFYLPAVDNIFLEYGINDVSAVMCGFTSLQTVIISFIKALDGIKQVNEKADIKFLALATNHDIIYKHSKLQCDYLKNDYFKGYDFNFPVNICTAYYEQLIEAIGKKIEIIPMIDDMRFFDENAECISNDNLHPNEKGHSIIAENIKKYM
jgi:lysophospholipase L1-like esterase